MRRVTDVNFALLSQQEYNSFAHRTHLIPVYRIVPHLEETIQHYKTVSFIPEKSICSFNLADEKYSLQQSPNDSLADFQN